MEHLFPYVLVSQSDETVNFTSFRIAALVITVINRVKGNAIVKIDCAGGEIYITIT